MLYVAATVASGANHAINGLIPNGTTDLANIPTRKVVVDDGNAEGCPGNPTR